MLLGTTTLSIVTASRIPTDLPMTNPPSMQTNEMKVGNYVTLCDTDKPEDDRFHLCEIIVIEDDKAQLLNLVTWTSNIRTAKFCTLYQQARTQRYTTERPLREADQQRVIDEVPIEIADDYIDHYDIKLTQSMRISASSQKQLK